MARILVKPAPGKTPRSPLAPHPRVPADGFVQEDCPDWRRMELSGDVIITDASAEADPKPKK